MFVPMTVRRAESSTGRVLDLEGRTLGTCFQVAPGILVTALHVVAGSPGSSVQVEGVNGRSGRVAARVLRVDPGADLAVLERAEPLPESIPGFAAADSTPRGAEVVVTGVSDERDGPGPGWVEVSGIWPAGATRDARVPLGRLTSDAVTPLMSGAPVVRVADGLVVGLVTSRYNSSDGWLKDSVWISRTESIEQLLDGIVPATERRQNTVEVTLSVSDAEVRVGDATARHDGPDRVLMRLLDDFWRARVRGRPMEADGRLGRIGEIMARCFLPPPVAAALAEALDGAAVLRALSDARTSGSVRLAVDASSLAELPWEAMTDPASGQPLALRPDVTVFRHVAAPRREPAAGPLRIVVAIASPEDDESGRVDYEAELREILAAVRPARRLGAAVRILPFATVRSIRAAIEDDAPHILHLVCGGAGSEVVLEDGDGQAVRLSPAAVIRGTATPPSFVLSGPERAGDLLFRELVEAGAPCVIAVDGSASSLYATELHTRVYAGLAQTRIPDVLPIVAEARRVVHQQLRDSYNTPDQDVARREEWSVVRLFAAAASVPAYGPARPAPPPKPPIVPPVGLPPRPAARFVGRRHELRLLSRLLDPGSPVPGVLLHGLGGVGKTTLASELVRRAIEREPGRPVLSVAGSTSADGVLAAVAAALRKNATGPAAEALRACEQPELPWLDRFELLSNFILGDHPVLIVLDNFEDNLVEADGWQVADSSLAGLLATWLARPGLSRFVVTSRFPFALDGRQRLREHRVGPLSLAETLTLIWSLPHLDRLGEPDIERVWRMVGGHPRTLEYLDALLAGGVGQFDDITARLARIVDRLGAPRDEWMGADRDVDAALADSLAVMAEDVLIDEHLARLAAIPGAIRLLVGAGVYREPVDRAALLFQVGGDDEGAGDESERRALAEETGAILGERDIGTVLADEQLPRPERDRLLELLERYRRPPRPPITTDFDIESMLKVLLDTNLVHVEPDSRDVFVHRWTAAEIERRLPTHELADVHRRAARYWLWRVATWPQDKQADVHDLLEARHHLTQAGDFEGAGRATEAICARLDDWGAWDRERDLIQDTLRTLPEDSPRRMAWIHQLGLLAHRRGDYAQAERHYREALALAERLGEDRYGAIALHQLGILSQSRGDYAEAAHSYRLAADRNLELGNHSDLSRTYHQLGILAQLQGDYTEAERWYQRSLTTKEKTGDLAGLARSHHQLGLLAQERGDYGEALRRFHQALSFSESIGDQAATATTYHQLGTVAQVTGDYDAAEQRYRQALAIGDRLGDEVALARGYHELGVLFQLRGRLDEAERSYRQSLVISERLGDRSGMAATLGQLGSLSRTAHRFDEAENYYQQSLTISEELGDRSAVGRLLNQLGTVAHMRGDYPGAETLYRRALTVGEELGDRASIASANHQLGVLAWDDGQGVRAAVPPFLSALVTGLQIESPQAVAGSARELSRIRAEVGDAAFREAVAAVLDDESLDNLNGVLDSLSEDDS
ncbi:tetratricopeptide repeat protein [Micromonospora sp. NPDC049204]|uniref:tetratricopeptide repeat protein n=1 Tax=Micromonospora sp. NPDC049204 TaxID=3154351 RepID=UPI003400FA9F